ncbi:MAG TPA: hypothetical protein VKM72_33365 [Thermoanaerobaculia bacterium]|nr:hypothetical protein [Thermoanaerobaculia bacterium]
MDLYLPPAGIDDFSRSQHADDLRQSWHDQVTSFLRQIRDPSRNEQASPLFYDQVNDTSGVADSEPQGIPWNGFPLRLNRWFGQHPPQVRDELANRAAEVVLRLPVQGLFREDRTPLALPFRVQDEYCEWHVEREGETIRRISFTCEPPEYWELLASVDFDLVHRLYRELLHNDEIPADDLRWPFDVFRASRNGQLVPRFRRGDYNPWSIWNTERGAVHLTHPANSLFAEVALASDGTLGWPVSPDAQGQIDPQRLMCCAGRGGINRSSDPLILKGVFDFARQGLSVALANPIGLYMAPFGLGGLLSPDEEPVGEALRFVRQSSDGSRILRAEVAAPEGTGFTLDQCTLDGLELRHGGQIARQITMRLFGVAKRIPGRSPRRVQRCPTFCCTHPTHPEFLGTFPARTGSCDRVTDQDWRNEAFDVPDFPEAEPEARGRAAFLEAGIAEVAASPETEPMQPVGRRVTAAMPSVEIEDLGS